MQGELSQRISRELHYSRASERRRAKCWAVYTYKVCEETTGKRVLRENIWGDGEVLFFLTGGKKLFLCVRHELARREQYKLSG